LLKKQPKALVLDFVSFVGVGGHGGLISVSVAFNAAKPDLVLTSDVPLWQQGKFVSKKSTSLDIGNFLVILGRT